MTPFPVSPKGEKLLLLPLPLWGNPDKFGMEGGKLQIALLLFIITDTSFENFLKVYQVEVPLI